MSERFHVPKMSELAEGYGFDDPETFQPFADSYGSGLISGSQLAAYETQTEHFKQVYYDPLTGLPNRAGFFLAASAALKLMPADLSAVVFLADVNNLKEINDEYGHAAGDALLKDVGERLNKSVHYGVVSHLHGDEFAVLTLVVEDLGVTAEMSADWQRDILRESCNVSVGRSRVHSKNDLQSYPDHQYALGRMLHQADLKMLAHKRSLVRRRR